MKDVLTVETLIIESGEKRCGPLKIASRADGSDIYVPLMVVNGKEDGPIFNISGGCHGDEYDGMEAIRRVYRALDPLQFKGALIAVPVLNTIAFEAGQRISPFDHLNLNRVFPGKERGFITERLAYIYFNEVIKKADYVIDLHAGGIIMKLAPMAIYRDIGGPDVAKKAEKLIKSTGIDLVWKGSGGWTGPISLEAQKIGIPAITVEIGGEGRSTEHVTQQFEKLIYNAFKSFEMMEGEPELPEEIQHFEGNFISTISGGFYEQKVDLREMVKKNDLLATVCDFYGNIVEEIHAPYDGIVCSKRTLVAIEPGGWTLMLGRLV